MHGTPAQRNTATLETPQRTTGVSVRALTEGARPAHAVGRGDAASRGAATAAGRAGLLLQERAEREDQTQRKLDAALEAARGVRHWAGETRPPEVQRPPPGALGSCFKSGPEREDQTQRKLDAALEAA